MLNRPNMRSLLYIVISLALLLIFSYSNCDSKQKIIEIKDSMTTGSADQNTSDFTIEIGTISDMNMWLHITPS